MSGKPTSIKRKGVPKGLDLKASISTPTGAQHVGGPYEAASDNHAQGAFVPSRAAPATPPASVSFSDYQFGAARPSLDTQGSPVRPPRPPISLGSREEIVERPSSAMSNNEYYDADSTPVISSGPSFQANDVISPRDARPPAQPVAQRARSDEADVAGHIAFRSGATTPTRTLYSAPLQSRRTSTYLSEIPMPSRAAVASSPIRSTTLPDMMGVDGRRPSLVKPEDYVPGYAITTDGGKAMTAGFEKPASPGRAAVRNEILVQVVAPADHSYIA